MGRLRHLKALLIAAVGIGSGNGASAQTIRGQLMDMHTDAPIDLGLIIMVSATGDSVTSTLSSPTGRFSVSADGPGEYLLLAAALGYKETRVGLFELGEGGEMSVEFRLWPEPLSIDGIMVQSLVREPQLVRNGYYRRMQRGTGTFITPSDLEEATQLRAIEILTGIPGTRMTMDPVDGERFMVRGAQGYCVPDLIIDGVRTNWRDTSMRLDELVPLESLYAIEVHRGVAGIPIEFGSFNQCGLLVFWTVRGARRE